MKFADVMGISSVYVCHGEGMAWRSRGCDETSSTHRTERLTISSAVNEPFVVSNLALVLMDITLSGDLQRAAPTATLGARNAEPRENMRNERRIEARENCGSRAHG